MPIDIATTRAQLERAKKQIDQERRREKNDDRRAMLMLRLRVLEREIEHFNRLYPPRTVFVSFSKDHGGREIFNEVVKQLAKKFKVEHGESPGGEVRDAIVEPMKRSAVFVGIMNKQTQLVLDPAAPQQRVFYSPGTWVITETGMAFAFRMPLVLFVHEEVDERYWLPYKQFGHPRFNDANWKQRIRVLVESVEMAFDRLER